jgi:hypothetical protein
MQRLEDRQLLSTLSAVSWVDSQTGLAHHEVFAVAPNNSVEVSQDGGRFISLGGYAKQISAGLDASGNPEVFAIGANNYVNVYRGRGWVGLPGAVSAKQISATVKNTVYAIGLDNSVDYNNGGAWVRLPGTVYAKQISAGADARGNPEVFEINQNDALYVSRGGGGFTQLGSAVEQISGTMKDTVFALNRDESISEYVGSNVSINLGGDVRQISAGLDALGNPEVFAIGLNDVVYLNHGSGHSNLGGLVRDLSAPAVGIALPGDVAYVVGLNHEGYLHQGAAGNYISLNGSVQLPSGSSVNNTDSWEPATTALSSIGWVDNLGHAHHEVFAIGSNDNVEVSRDGGRFTSLGGFQALQVSAGLDSSGNPEVFALGLDNAVYVNRGGTSFIPVGGWVRAISATVKNTVYAIGFDHAVYANSGYGWVNLGGYAKQISAGADARGNPEVFEINQNDALYVNRGSGLNPVSAFHQVGSQVKQISGTMKDTVFAINQNDSVSEFVGSNGPINLGGYAKQIAAGLDALGNPEVFTIDENDALAVNHGSGFIGLGGAVSEVSAPAVSIAQPGDLAYVAGLNHEGFLHQGPGSSYNDLYGWVE